MRYSGTSSRIFSLFVAIVSWFALVLQLYLNIHNATANGLTVPETIGRYFGYFTILTNLLVALTITIPLVTLGGGARFFSRPGVQTAIAVYIFFVGLSYNILLRQTWNPQGHQRIADELLHVIVPILFVFYWFLFVKASELRWKQWFSWLLYPVLYIVFALARGSIDGFYPYYFIDASKLNPTHLAINLAGLLAAVVVLSYLFIALGKWKSK